MCEVHVLILLKRLEVLVKEQDLQGYYSWITRNSERGSLPHETLQALAAALPERGRRSFINLNPAATDFVPAYFYEIYWIVIKTPHFG